MFQNISGSVIHKHRQVFLHLFFRQSGLDIDSRAGWLNLKNVLYALDFEKVS